MNEQDTSFCKHNHMIKRGAPPDNSEFCTEWLPIEFHGFTSRIGYHSLVPGLISIFLETVWVPLTPSSNCSSPPISPCYCPL